MLKTLPLDCASFSNFLHLFLIDELKAQSSLQKQQNRSGKNVIYFDPDLSNVMSSALINDCVDVLVLFHHFSPQINPLVQTPFKYFFALLIVSVY